MIMGNVALILTTFIIIVLITISISCMCNIFIFKGNLKMKVKEIYSYCLHFVSLVFSTISIVLCCPRVIDKGNLGFDYMGIIVGILSLLVGFLVAWQIYKTIEVDKKIEAMNNSSKDAIAEDMFYKWYSRLLEDCHIGLILACTRACISALNMNFAEDKAKLFYGAFKLHDKAYYGMGKESVDEVRAELDK